MMSEINLYSKKLVNYFIVTLVCLIAVIFSYYDVFLWMLERYLGADSYYSHGFLVPFIFIYLVWCNRDYFSEATRGYSLFGLTLIVASILGHLFGTVVYVFSISGFSFWILIVGLVWFFFGWRFTSRMKFPLLFLLFMFPMPTAVINLISFPLKVFVAIVGSRIASIVGVPLLLDGFVITIPQGELLVGNPCSGLRSLIAFIALGALFAYFSKYNYPRKMILFLSAVPIAIFSNLIRVPLLIICSYEWGLESSAPGTIVHTGSGVLVFVLGLILLGFVHYLLGIRYEA